MLIILSNFPPNPIASEKQSQDSNPDLTQVTPGLLPTAECHQEEYILLS